MAEPPKTILIVEDDKSFLWILRQSFTGEGFVVIFAQDGEEGIKMAEEEKPDLILLDIMLPEMDGIAVAKSLREKGVKSQIIFLTNLKDETSISKAMEAVSNTEYIIKSDMGVNSIVDRVKSRLNVK